MDGDVAVKVAQLEQRSKSNSHRLDKVEERQDGLEKLAASVEVLTTRQAGVESDLKEIKSDVKSLAEKPSKRWETVLAALMTGAVGFLLARMGLA